MVVAIISILAAMLMPALGKTREKGYQLRCMNNLRQLGITFSTYINEWDGLLPPNGSGTGTWDNWNNNDTARGNILHYNSYTPLICPTAQKIFTGYTGTLRGTYTINQYVGAYTTLVGNNTQVFSGIAKPASTVWAYDGKQYPAQPYASPSGSSSSLLYCHTGGADVLFCDGHVEWKTEGELTNDNFYAY